MAALITFTFMNCLCYSIHEKKEEGKEEREREREREREKCVIPSFPTVFVFSLLLLFVLFVLSCFIPVLLTPLCFADLNRINKSL